MYEELVKSLRELCEMTALCEDYSCFECPYEEKCSSYKNGKLSSVYRQSADAIEELSRENESLAKSVNEASEILRRRWVPVAERLPEKFENVLVANKRGKHYDIDKGWWNGSFFDRCAKGSYSNVTHWMPLPEPPMEDKS